MRRRYLLGFVAAAIALLAIPTAAMADPPGPPVALYYGKATGATVGQQVVAMVGTGGSFVACGTGEILDDSGPVYAVDVISNSQAAGCGQAGRTVRIYILPLNNPTIGGQLSNESSTLGGSFTATKFDVTFGAALPRQAVGIFVAQDGLPF